MSLKLRIVMFIFSLLLLLLIVRILRKDKMPIKYAIIWIFAFLLMLLVSLVPSFLTAISNLLGFEAMASMVIGMMIVILLIISIILTMIVSSQNKTITTLIQEISLLKEKNK